MLYNGSARPGLPGRRQKWLAEFNSQGAFTIPLSLWRFPLLGFGIVFAYQQYFSTKMRNVNIFP
jgi:hypothetical protein